MTTGSSSDSESTEVQTNLARNAMFLARTGQYGLAKKAVEQYEANVPPNPKKDGDNPKSSS